MGKKTELSALLESFDLSQVNHNITKKEGLHYFDYLIQSLPKDFKFVFKHMNLRPEFGFSINNIDFNPEVSFDQEIESYSLSPLFLNLHFNVTFDDDNEFGDASKLFTINSRIDAIFNYLQHPSSES